MTEGPHLELDALADLLVGEGEETDVAHVAGCAACSARLVELDEAQGPVAAALAAYAALDVPAPPPDLAERLRAALEDEAPPAGATASAGPAVDAEPGEHREPAPVVPLRRRPARGPGVLGVAAGLAGLLVVAGLGIGVVGLGSGSDSADSSTAASSGEGSDDALEAAGGGSAADTALAAPAPSPRATGTDYRRDPAALAAALPGLLGADEQARAYLETAPDSAAQRSSAAPGPLADAGSGAVSGSTGGGAPAAAVAPDPLARLREPAALSRCLAALPPAGPVRTPLAVDFASLEGRPAVVLVLPGDRPETVELVAVGAGCGADGPDELYRTELPRPE